MKRLDYDTICNLQVDKKILCGYVRSPGIEGDKYIGTCSLTKQRCNTIFKDLRECDSYKEFYRNYKK